LYHACCPVDACTCLRKINKYSYSYSYSSVVNTGGKFATGVNDTGGKFATGVNDAGAVLPPVSTTPVANNGNNYQTADNLK
jgi:hypothetical protein